MSCPCCNSHKSIPESNHGIQSCCKCGAVFGQCYLGESYNIVFPYWHKGNPIDVRYFDLVCLGSQGIVRRHGWYDPVSRRVLQVG